VERTRLGTKDSPNQELDSAVVASHRHAAQRVSAIGFARLTAYFAKETLDHAFVVVVDSALKLPAHAIRAGAVRGFRADER
jgi:hypothetical protein